MGDRGPAPTPSNILRLRGSDIPDRRERRDEPLLPSVELDPPADLLPDAVPVWRAFARRLGPRGLAVLTDADETALAQLCEFHVLWMRLRGSVLVGGDVSLLRDFIKVNEQYQRMAAKFGLTPSDRTRVQAIPAPPSTDEGESL